MSSSGYYYEFAALRGRQAGREYYIAMSPMKLLPKLFVFDEEELKPEFRAQRKLNQARVPEMARYVVQNPREYVFSSITASIDGKPEFIPTPEKGITSHLGGLRIPMDAKLVINDGQHRRAAIEEALKERPELGDETISVVFFVDAGLKRSQQMFADLNKHAVRPTKSLGILYDHRDSLSQLARSLITAVPFFKGLTETEKTTISNRSIKLFTLSGIYQGTRALLNKFKSARITPQEEELAIDFWIQVGRLIPEWELAQEKKVSAAELRRDFIHAHALALHALGLAGQSLIAAQPKKWKHRLRA